MILAVVLCVGLSWLVIENILKIHETIQKDGLNGYDDEVLCTLQSFKMIASFCYRVFCMSLV